MTSTAARVLASAAFADERAVAVRAPKGREQVSAGANEWCRVLGIEAPKLEAVARHREANTFALLLVALLERGEPMTLDDVAARFEEAGIAERARARQSLARCKPGRPPVYRDGEQYHLDPHDDELDLWAFRLGLRPPRRHRELGSGPAPSSSRVRRSRRLRTPAITRGRESRSAGRGPASPGG